MELIIETACKISQHEFKNDHHHSSKISNKKDNNKTTDYNVNDTLNENVDVQ